MRTNPLIGKTIKAVYLADDGGAIRFEVQGEGFLTVRADGDCCSHTWIESIEGAERMLGTVTAVEDIDMPSLPYNEQEHESLAFYGCKISTEKGSAVIDYRNSSNGYYGGNLAWPDEYFYGGVYSQNVSNENWKRIAG